MEMNPTSGKQRVLVTGATGVVGTVLCTALAGTYDLVLVDRRAVNAGTIVVDLTDEAALDRAFKGIGPVDSIVHLAATPDPQSAWDNVLSNNIIATKNVYECARKHGVKKIVFTSTTHLYGGYEGYPQSSAPFDRPIRADDPPRPDSDYGTSKGFGELLARQYYDLYGLRSICIRIGGVSKEDRPGRPYEKLWLSHRDLIQVFDEALRSDIPFGRYFAISNNEDPVYDISQTTRDLGYEPQDGISAT